MFLKYSDNWGGLNRSDNAFNDAMYKRYVPACGKCDTLGGEILRAINRIVYKFYNDGDTVSRYDSSLYNHSFGAEKFLYKHVPGYILMRDISHSDYEGFEKALCKNFKITVDYLQENPALFEVKNGEDFLNLSPKEEWPDEEEEYDEWEDDNEEE